MTQKSFSRLEEQRDKHKSFDENLLGGKNMRCLSKQLFVQN